MAESTIAPRPTGTPANLSPAPGASSSSSPTPGTPSTPSARSSSTSPDLVQPPTPSAPSSLTNPVVDNAPLSNSVDTSSLGLEPGLAADLASLDVLQMEMLGGSPLDKLIANLGDLNIPASLPSVSAAVAALDRELLGQLAKSGDASSQQIDEIFANFLKLGQSAQDLGLMPTSGKFDLTALNLVWSTLSAAESADQLMAATMRALTGQATATLTQASGAAQLARAAQLSGGPLGLPQSAILLMDGTERAFALGGTFASEEGAMVRLVEANEWLTNGIARVLDLPLEQFVRLVQALIVPDGHPWPTFSGNVEQLATRLGLTDCCMMAARGLGDGSNSRPAVSGSLSGGGQSQASRCLTCPLAQALYDEP